MTAPEFNSSERQALRQIIEERFGKDRATAEAAFAHHAQVKALEIDLFNMTEFNSRACRELARRLIESGWRKGGPT